MAVNLRIYELLSPIYSPTWGESIKHDTTDIELEFEKDSETYLIQGKIETTRNIWYWPETRDSPREDDVEISKFALDIEIASKIDNITEDEIYLNKEEIKELTEYLQKKFRIYIINETVFRINKRGF